MWEKSISESFFLPAQIFLCFLLEPSNPRFAVSFLLLCLFVWTPPWGVSQSSFLAAHICCINLLCLDFITWDLVGRLASPSHKLVHAKLLIADKSHPKFASPCQEPTPILSDWGLQGLTSVQASPTGPHLERNSKDVHYTFPWIFKT